MNSIKEVASRAGVSIATVSRVINSSKNVSEDVKKRVNSAMAELNYTPNTLAKTMRTQKSNYIGIIVSDISDPFFTELYSILENELSEQGFNTILLNGQVKNVDKIIQSLYHWSIEGVIICFANIINEWNELLKKYRRKIPFVFMETTESSGDYNRIYMNVEDGMCKAVKYLINNGHKNIAFFRGDANLPDGRYKGYLRALEDSGIKFDPRLIFEGEYSLYSGQIAAASLLEMENRPTAIVTVNDIVASGALKFFLKNGIKVPEDINIIGFDDTMVSRASYPELTTVRIPIKALGENASRMLVNSIKKQNTKKMSLIIDSELIIRETTS